jgi:hypothetical protein
MSSRPILLFTLALSIAPAIAEAETRLVPVVFGKMTGRRAGGDLVIEYRVTNKSWRALEDDRVRPKLHVSLENADRGRPQRVTFDRELSRQEGEVTFSIPSSLGKLRLEVWVTGGHRGTHIAWMDLGGVEVERASLRVTSSPGAPPPPVMNPHTPTMPPPSGHNWAAEPHVIQACGAAFDGPANEKACVAAVKRSPRDPIAAITACEAAMDGDGNELECVRRALDLSFDPISIIAACESSMDGDENELECIRISGRFRKDPIQVIAACDSARAGDPDELDCLRTAAN